MTSRRCLVFTRTGKDESSLDSGRNCTVLQIYLKLKWFSKRFLYLILFIFAAKTWLFSTSRRRSTSTWWSNAEAILDQESATWTHGSTKWEILSSLKCHGIICFYMQGPPNSYLHVFPLFAMFDDFKKMYCPNEQLTVQWTLSIWMHLLDPEIQIFSFKLWDLRSLIK